MIALQLLELLFLFGAVYGVQGSHYVGIKFLLDSSLTSCSPYTNGLMEQYLQAFTGGVDLRFRELLNPGVRVFYYGWRRLDEDEERDVIGDIENARTKGVKGGDAINKIMDIALLEEDGELIGANIVAMVLTWHGVTEEITKKKTVTPTIPDSGSPESESESESDENALTLSQRSNSKHKFPNVSGVAQYGSVCQTVSVAICQDNGRNFSGVATAAQLIATILGPMYNGSISRRNCPDDEDPGVNTEFHDSNCYTEKTLKEKIKTETDLFECLSDATDDSKQQIKNPSEFFKINKQWTPCGMAYDGTTTCQENTTHAETKNICHMSCCGSRIPSAASMTYEIPNPDGDSCGDNGKVCVDGKCITVQEPGS